MKLIKNLINIFVTALFVLPSANIFAKEKTQNAEVDIYDLSFDDNLAMPELGKSADEIVKFQYNQANALSSNKLFVELTRNREVVIITLPAAQLFAPNDTVLSETGKKVIEPFLNYLKTPGMYKMLLVMHHDNTGSERYIVKLTEARVNSIYDWMKEKTSVDYVVPYALGATDPLVENNSVANRKFNRRLEIYLVPEMEMIKAAKKKKITL